MHHPHPSPDEISPGDILEVEVANFDQATMAGSGSVLSLDRGIDFQIKDSDYDRILQSELYSGLHVPEGQAWKIEPGAHVKSDANVVVEGTLVGRGSGDVTNPTRLQIVGAVESEFSKGGMEPVPNGWGVWVVGSGVLDFQGTPKTSWTYDPANAIGWGMSDEVVVTPVAKGDYSFAPWTGQQFGQVAVPWEHNGRQRVWTPEVLNLSRDLVISGTPKGRSHVLFHGHSKQTLGWFGLEHLGPRMGDGTDRGHTILGKWALHFHHCLEGSNGSVVEGVVSTNNGAHSFVAHASHGVTFRDCIGYKVMETPFWWDFATAGDRSNNVTYERCVAAGVAWGDKDKSGKNPGFLMTGGTGNTCRDCVATVISGKTDASGFNWGTIGMSAGWTFQNNLSHNIAKDGLYLWQNPSRAFPIEGFQGYHLGRQAVLHGAYGGGYRFVGSEIWGAPVVIRASSAGRTNPPLTHENMNIGGSDYGFVFEHHNNVAESYAYFRANDYWDIAKAPILLKEAGERYWARIVGNMVHSGDSVVDLDPSKHVELVKMHPDSRYEFQDSKGNAKRLHPDGSVTDIAAFE